MKRFTILLVLALAACGGGSSPKAAPATTSTTSAAGMSQKEQADAYLAATAPGNAAVTKFRASVNDGSTQDEYATAGEELATSFSSVDDALARVAFTGQAATDVRTLVGAVGAFVGDLRSIRDASAFSVAGLQATISRDLGAMGAAITVVRADLGLPPTSS